MALGGARDRQHVVDRHRNISDENQPNRLPNAARGLSLCFISRVIQQKFYRDPQNEPAADQLDIVHGEQSRGDESQPHPRAPIRLSLTDYSL